MPDESIEYADAQDATGCRRRKRVERERKKERKVPRSRDQSIKTRAQEMLVSERVLGGWIAFSMALTRALLALAGLSCAAVCKPCCTGSDWS